MSWFPSGSDSDHDDGTSTGGGQADKNLRCQGKHPVNGGEGCHNEGCRGKRFCVSSCKNCPDAVASSTDNTKLSGYCKGGHSVADKPNGAVGCNNQACAGRTYCVAGCPGCPDDPANSEAVARRRALLVAEGPAQADRLPQCQGNHSVSGGCENEGCRGKTWCVSSCTGCPDL